MKILVYFALASLFVLISCESATGPNEIGGDTNIELTKVGNEFGINFDFTGLPAPNYKNIKDTIVITKNENGIVTFDVNITTDFKTYYALDTMMGTHIIPAEMKRQFVDYYLNRYDATLDTTDKDNVKLHFELKLKITSEGVQDFLYSGGNTSKPFTLVKYNSNVGDKYEFTSTEGKKITRKVVQKNPEEDWNLVFWQVKTIRVEEELPDDPMFEKITYIANHKFGIVGAILLSRDGKEIVTHITPWGVL